jgi:exosortase C (VPDSG-CTERM-specific)
MNKPDTIAVAMTPPAMDVPQPSAPPPRRALIAAVALGALFSPTLYHLLVFARNDDLYSYILLVPFVSAYAAWQKRTALPRRVRQQSRWPSLALLGSGILLACYGLWRNRWGVPTQDELALSMTAFLVSFGGIGLWFFGPAGMRVLRFPFLFLIFLIPIPTALLSAIELVLQHGSAAAARGLFFASGTPVYYHDLGFQLPVITLRVAPECSGIRSTLALALVSLVTAHFFLRSPLHRAALICAVVPLAMVRNGFRIFTIGELCVQSGPQMIDSYAHRHGGPLFFALSLVPFFLLAVLLRRRERARRISA